MRKINILIFKFLNKLRSTYFILKSKLFYGIFFGKIGKDVRIIDPILIINPHNFNFGNNVFIRNSARLEGVGDGKIIIGNFSSFEQNLHITSGKKVEIGNNVTASFNVMITDIDHDYTQIDTHILDQKYIFKETKIGDYCFLGAGVRIQAGTILGKQCIVGTNSVVRGEFPDYSVIVGSPAKIVKRYDSTQKLWRKTDTNGNFL